MTYPLPMLDFITRSVRMPSIPTIYAKVAAIVSDPDSSVHDMARTIEEDQTIAARTLKVANSAAFGLRNPAVSIEHACSALGMVRVRSVVLQTSLMQNFASIQAQGFDLEGFWRHASLVGTTCRILAQDCGPALGMSPDEAYTCGLLHDVGIVLMLDSFPTAYLEAIERTRKDSIGIEQAEAEIFGFSHSEAGAALAQRWRFPAPVVFSVRYHHEVPEGEAHEGICLLVAAANGAVEAIEEGEEPISRLGLLCGRAMDRLGIGAEAMHAALEKVEELFRTMEQARSPAYE